MFRICCTRFLIYYEVFIAARLELSTLAITTHPPSCRPAVTMAAPFRLAISSKMGD